jgi:hypothetical protein
VQVIQVILTPLSQRFLATLKVVPFSAVAGQAVPAQARAAQRGLARSRPLRGHALPEVVLSIVRSYAWSVEVRMEGEIDDLVPDEIELDSDVPSSP